MDEFRLKVFVTAAKALSFSKCAAALNITQPAVSRHIGELEARFGVPLFSRGSSGVGLTKAGRLLLQHAEGLLSAYQKMDYDMDLLAQAGQGRLAIGASTTIAMYGQHDHRDVPAAGDTGLVHGAFGRDRGVHALGQQ